MNSTKVINFVCMRDAFTYYLVTPLQNVAGEAHVVQDSVSAHIYPTAFDAFRSTCKRYATSPAVLAMHFQAIDMPWWPVIAKNVMLYTTKWLRVAGSSMRLHAKMHTPVGYTRTAKTPHCVLHKSLRHAKDLCNGPFLRNWLCDGCGFGFGC